MLKSILFNHSLPNLSKVRALSLSKGVLTVLLSLSSLFSSAQDAAEGEKLFLDNCTSCHSISEKITGPALKDVHKRRDEKWLISWIKNSQAMVKSGDPQAVALFKEYNGTVMNTFANFSDGQVKSILAYIKKESETPTTPVATTPGTPAAEPAQGGNGGLYNTTTLAVLIGIALILAIIVLLLMKVRGTMRRMLSEKFPVEYGEMTGSWYQDKFKPWYKRSNKTVVWLNVSIFAILVLALYGYSFGNKEVGVQQGYAPSQPINFSHKLHAGDLTINCQYCHSTADKSKQASIPSASTCMNCHMYVDGSKIVGEDGQPKYGGKKSPEIMAIYNAIGWDADRRAYDNTKAKTPIKWVRIHNLPDHAYFNHSQHVKVGKLQCQECHGPVQEMEKVYQFSTLQMGWCIDCHRTKNIDVAGNQYYTELHQQLKSENKQYITVAENGGLECSKCHY